MCVVMFAAIAITTTADEGVEYFIKLSSDKQTLYLQDTYTDPGPDDVNIVLINTGQLNGHLRVIASLQKLVFYLFKK